MEVLAERDKGSFIGYLIVVIFCIFLLWLGLSNELVEEKERIATFIISAVLAIYLTVDIIKPKKVVVREDDCIIVYNLFSKKIIKIRDLKNASCEEISSSWIFGHGRVYSYHRVKKDIRTLIISIKEDNTIKYIKVPNVKNATEASLSIKALVIKEQETYY